MLNSPDYEQARELLLTAVMPVGTESIPLSFSGGRILAETLTAQDNVPAFDRSPYDGYAFRAADVATASKDTPVTLRILEEVPAGAVPTVSVTKGCATKVLTGAPVPDGADVVVKFEITSFTEETVTIYEPVKAGDNIVRTGEDIKKGEVLAQKGMAIDPGLAGTLAAQGVAVPGVYRRPKVALLSIGSELVEAGDVPDSGKIRNSNRYMLETALRQIGCESVYLGIAGDSVDEIAMLLKKGILLCDAVITTGGVSVGDYDLTPEAMASIGAEILFRGVNMKPGMTCAYAVCNGKLLCGLSGNPASSLTNFYAVALPALKKLTGRRDYMPQETCVTLLTGLNKKSPVPRFLRGKLRLENGVVSMEMMRDQGNVILSSTIGCDIMAMIPAGSGLVSAGAVLKGFLI